MDQKIIFKTVFGSDLYGTATPTSDRDFKGVYMENLEDIVLGRDKETRHENTKTSSKTKNTPDDVDVEWIELRRFLKDCMDGQTYALDMLFAPQECWVESTPIWEEILEQRHLLLSRNVQPYIGYCRHQAGKYGLKGSRLGELLRILQHLKGQKPTAKLEEALLRFDWSEFVKIVEIKDERGLKGKSGIFLEVLGKKFELTKMVKEVLPSLELTNEKYGERAVLAMKNEGVDFKAISHAFRLCYQLLELATTGGIKFPLEKAAYIRDIKTGQIPYVDIQEPLAVLMEEAVKAVENSDLLPESPMHAFWERFILRVYLNELS